MRMIRKARWVRIWTGMQILGEGQIGEDGFRRILHAAFVSNQAVHSGDARG